MSVALPHGRMVLTSDEAAAYAVMLARARAIGCYPITPQTVIVERLADLVAERGDVEFANVESEHAMFGYVIGASRAGVRTFTATSSQGLLYAHEQLHRASRERVPLVAVNINRAVFAPWSIQPDLSDSMSQRDTGWIQLYCASAQEVVDSILCAYRIAETVDAAGAGLRRGLPALAHLGGRRDPGAEHGRRLPAGVPRAGRLGARPRAAADVLRAAGAEGLLRVPAARRRGDGRRAEPDRGRSPPSSPRTSAATRPARSRSRATRLPMRLWSRSGRSATRRSSCSTTTTTSCSSASMRTGRSRRRRSRPHWPASRTSRSSTARRPSARSGRSGSTCCPSTCRT